MCIAECRVSFRINITSGEAVIFAVGSLVGWAGRATGSVSERVVHEEDTSLTCAMGIKLKCDTSIGGSLRFVSVAPSNTPIDVSPRGGGGAECPFP